MTPLALCSVDRIRDITLVTLTGEIDLSNADAVRTEIAGLDPTAPLVIDVSGLSYMDSTGIHLLSTVGAGRTSEIRVIATPDCPASRLIEITGLDSLIDVFGSIDDALA
jgi:anti-sigma B factor antagonist